MKAWVARRWDVGGLLAPLHLVGCDRVGTRVRTYGRPLICNLGHISIGDEVVLRSRSAPVVLSTGASGEIEIGRGTTLELGVSVSARASVRIGRGVELGPFVTIRDHGEDTSAGALPVEIGDGVKLGPRVRVEPGARIEPGVTVPAGTVVGCADGLSARAHAEPARAPAQSPNQLNAAPSPVARTEFQGLVVADFTADDLGWHLSGADFDGLAMVADFAPFDQVVPSLLELRQRAAPPLAFVVVWSLAERVSPSFRRLLLGHREPIDAILSEVDAFASLIGDQADLARVWLVPSFCQPPFSRGYGMLEFGPNGVANALLRMNLRLSEGLSKHPNVFVLDTQRWVAAAGAGAMNPKRWYLGKVPFSGDVFAEAANDLKAALRGALGRSRKLVVLDLDETLWGGVVGDVGWEGLRLGGHDAEGEAFVEFQHRLAALTRRGVTLAVVSKNEESVALEAMRSHPEMVVRPELLAAYRINWNDKAQNIAELVHELNLGLQSVVFIDDNPVERGRVRDALPEVFVPDWPADPTQYVRALESLRCFDTPRISDEDVERTRMYGTERERGALRTKVASFDDWLQALDIAVAFERLAPSNLARATQLLNKTNQMNLRTRRMSEPELDAWAQASAREVWAVRVADRYGDAGLTGVFSVERRGEDVFLEDYVLSCRVMGRRVEDSLVWAAVCRAKTLGGRKLVVEAIPTAKNKPCLDFWAKTPLVREGDALVFPLEQALPPPVHVQLAGLG